MRLACAVLSWTYSKRAVNSRRIIRSLHSSCSCCTTKGIASCNLHTVTSNRPITVLLVAPQRALRRTTCTQSPATSQSLDCLLHHKGHHIVQPAHSHQQQANHRIACCTTKGIMSCNLHTVTSNRPITGRLVAPRRASHHATCTVTSNRPITGWLVAPQKASHRATCTQSPATDQSPDCLLHHILQPAVTMVMNSR